ncbi:MAG TPA: twin-arginine translocase subunit TatC [Opitutaceae bacterium]|jgi:sec-independent protein translocase protein TatC
MAEAAPLETEDMGPKKSFWGHLADLRSALIRSAIAIGAAVIICLFASPLIVKVLMRPILRMHMFEKAVPTVTLMIGDSKLGPYPVSRDQFAGLPPGAAPNAVFRVGSAQVGGKQVATLTLEPNASPGERSDITLHNFSPAESFMVAFHVALFAALAVSSPFWIYFMGGFILPALNLRERRVVFGWLGWSVALFFVGAALTYVLLLPVALRASVEYSQLLGFSAQDWRAIEYINFACKFIFGMGLGFQFPIVVLFLVKIGVLTHKQLAKYRRHVAVVSLILGAVLTTPEVITQVAMAVPLYLLYEACIWIAWYWERKKSRPAAPA